MSPGTLFSSFSGKVVTFFVKKKKKKRQILWGKDIFLEFKLWDKWERNKNVSASLLALK